MSIVGSLKICVLAAVLVLCQLPARGQGRQHTRLQRLLRPYVDDSSNAGKPKFLAYPTIGYSPETGVEVGISSVYIFSAHNDLVNSRISEITAFLFLTQRSQQGIWSDHAIYSYQDKWFFLGRYRWQDFPLLYWGVGPSTKKNNDLVIDGRYVLLRERIMRKLAPNLFFGPEIDYQNLYKSTYNADELQALEEKGLTPPRGLNGASNLGLGASLVYDNRHNYLNVRRGAFMELSFLRYAASLGSDYRLTTAVVDGRLFTQPFAPKQTLAMQIYGQFTLAGSPPFNQYALLGNESLMRGYYTGRFRDRQYVAAQAEYRWLPLPFSKRFGFAASASAGQVGYGVEDLRLSNLKWSLAGGPRFLILPKTDIFVRIEAAFTQEGPGFYLFLGEAF